MADLGPRSPGGGPIRDPHPELPGDPDADAALPVHLRAGAIALVALGGAIGTAAREGLSLAIPDLAGIPVAIFGINVIGAFALGVLLESLARRGADRGRRRSVRLLIGTGVLGGFTTYSALAVDTVQLMGDGRPVVGVAYALGTVLVGGLATWLGIALASARRADPR